MRILRYSHLNENMNDTPENYVVQALQKIKSKIDKMFAPAQEVEQGKIKRFDGTDKKDQDMTLGDLGMQLQSSELSKYSKTHKNVKFKFTDEEFIYDLSITISLKNAVPKLDKEFSDKEIKKCFIVFKKYTIDDFKLIGQISKNVKIDDIKEDFLIKIKIELDDEFSDDKEEFEIVTENSSPKHNWFMGLTGIEKLEYDIKHGHPLSVREKSFINIAERHLRKLKKDDGYYCCGEFRCEDIKYAPIVLALGMIGSVFPDFFNDICLEQVNNSYKINVEYFNLFGMRFKSNEILFDEPNDLMTSMLLLELLSCCIDGLVDIEDREFYDIIGYNPKVIDQLEIGKFWYDFCEDHKLSKSLSVLSKYS